VIALFLNVTIPDYVKAKTTIKTKKKGVTARY
jgi:hypothetical protein